MYLLSQIRRDRALLFGGLFGKLPGEAGHPRGDQIGPRGITSVVRPSDCRQGMGPRVRPRSSRATTGSSRTASLRRRHERRSGTSHRRRPRALFHYRPGRDVPGPHGREATRSGRHRDARRTRESKRMWEVRSSGESGSREPVE
jgi:hypothetical protein